MEWICLTVSGTRHMRTATVSATMAQAHGRPTEWWSQSRMLRKRFSSGLRMLMSVQRWITRSQLPRGSRGGSAAAGAQPCTTRGRGRTSSWRRSRTASNWDGTCTSPREAGARPASGRRRRVRYRGTSCLRLLQHFADPLLEPVEAARVDRLRETLSRDEHVVVARRGRQVLPGLAQPALRLVTDHRAADLLRHGDAEARTVLVTVLTLEPVEHEIAGRDRASVAVDGVEIPRAGEPMAALHDLALRRTAASGPSRGGVSGSLFPRAWTCVHGSRACASDVARWADR